ncbi:hypothetical protein LINGRAHAP2_LOCUS6839 [Linum grandiflorum]
MQGERIEHSIERILRADKDIIHPCLFLQPFLQLIHTTSLESKATSFIIFIYFTLLICYYVLYHPPFMFRRHHKRIITLQKTELYYPESDPFIYIFYQY